MSDETFNEIQTWYLFFEPRDRVRHWWHWVLKKDFSHCYVARETTDGRTFAISAMKWGIATTFVDCGITDYIMHHMERCSAVIGFTVNYTKKEGFKLRGLITCVTLTKAILAVEDYAITPYQLYDMLCRRYETTVIKPYMLYPE